MKYLMIEGRREGYAPNQVTWSVTVGELKAILEDYANDTPVLLCNDNGYTYGSITDDSFFLSDGEEEEDEEEEEEEDEDE